MNGEKISSGQALRNQISSGPSFSNTVKKCVPTKLVAGDYSQKQGEMGYRCVRSKGMLPVSHFEGFEQYSLTQDVSPAFFLLFSISIS